MAHDVLALHSSGTENNMALNVLAQHALLQATDVATLECQPH